jgi:hypothetical protein
MRQQQQCKNCKNRFTDDAPQKNYKLYANYGFLNEEQFKNHNSGNKHCPCKITLNDLAIVHNNHENSLTNINNSFISEVEWGPYVPNISICEEDYTDKQEMIQLKLKMHSRGGNKLWFNTSQIAACTILDELLNSETQFITLVAEPGSGKTAVIHNLIYQMLMLPYDKAIHSNSITVTTGMSDTDWYNQIKNNFELRDGGYIWESIYKVDENACIVHRSSLHKRITWLLENLEYISNHRFIIDEHHIADEVDMTIDNEFKRLGLTEEKMKAYNIKIICVSATPDVSLSLMSRQENHKMVQLENGENYKGFKYYSTAKMIIDFDDSIILENLIRKTYSTPRFHYIRARTHTEKGTYRETILGICKKNNWNIIEDDSDNNYYLSFKKDDRERQAEISGKSIIRTYLPPLKHTFILIKNKYPASKRLKLTSYTGLVAEKPSVKMNTTVTCNGLIPRFWGYDELPDFHNNQKPIFMCNKNSVDEYIQFSSDFVYKGKSYTSNRVKSDNHKIKEFGITWPSNLVGAEAIIHDTKIGITNNKNGERDYFNSVEDIGSFLRSKGFTDVREVNKFNKGPNGYEFPRRNPEHDSEDKRLIQSDYENKFVKNGGGTHINRQWPSGTGQPYMIWPVYETMDSEPGSVKYYVHYLKI